MGIAKTSFNGNEYVGAFVTATEKFALVGVTLSPQKEELVSKTLGVEVIRISVDGSDLIGIYAAANSKGVLLPAMASNGEINALRARLPGLNVHPFSTDLNALKNDILVNDKIAIVDPNYSGQEIKVIRDVLDVEVIRLAIGGFETVGASNILTKTGVVLNSSASDDEVDRLKDVIGLPIEQSTANMGSASLGLCVAANSTGLLAGDATTGFELARITQGLGF